MPKDGVVFVNLAETALEFRDIAATWKDPARMTGVMMRVGKHVMDMIKARVRKGVGVNGPWIRNEYSPRYAQFRREHNRPVNRVTLEFGGTMWGSLTADAKPRKVRVFFPSTPAPPPRGRKKRKKKAKLSGEGKPKKQRRVTEAMKAYFNDKLRPFFSLNEAEIGTLEEEFKRYVSETIQFHGGKQ